MSQKWFGRQAIQVVSGPEPNLALIRVESPTSTQYVIYVENGQLIIRKVGSANMVVIEDGTIIGISPGSGIPPQIIDAKGDLIVGAGPDSPSRLAAGADGSMLVAASGTTTGLAWVPAPVPGTIFQAKGDLAVGTGLANATRLPAGGDGQVLIVDINSATGLRWTWSDAIPKGVLDTKGDLIAATGPDSPARVPPGADGQVLTADGAQLTGVKWATPSADIARSLIDAKGDLLVGQADDTPARLAVGTPAQVLTAAPGAPLGVQWATPSVDIPASLFDAKGDLITASGPDAPVRMPAGPDGQVLTADGNSPTGLAWSPPVSAGSGIPASILDAKGDLIAASAPDTPTIVSRGTDGHVLTADLASPAGVKWAAAPGAGGGIPPSIVDAQGDLIAGTANDTVARLPKGTANQVLAVGGAHATGLQWTTPAPTTPPDNSITDAMLRDAAARSVIGRAGATLGDPADIVAGADGLVLRRASGTLAFGALDLSAAGSVTGTLPAGNVDAVPRTLVNVRGDLVAATGDNAVDRLAAGTDGQVLTAAAAQPMGLQWQTPASAPPADNSITNQKLRDSLARSVIGRTEATGGDPADIVAAQDGNVLRRDAGTVTFGPINLAGGAAAVTGTLPAANIPAPLPAGHIPAPANDSITGAMLRNSAAVSVIGNPTAVLTDPTDIAATADGQVLRRAGGALAFGALDLADTDAVTGTLPGARVALDPNSATNTVIRDSAALSVIGNPTNSAADPADMAAGSAGNVLRRSGNTLGFGPLDLGGGAQAVTGTLPAGNLPAFISPTLLTTKGDLIARDATVPVRLAAGGNNQVLTADNAQPAGLKWTTPSDDIPKSLMDLQGDLIVATGNDAPARVPLGANGQVLTVATAQPTGVQWQSLAPSIPSTIVDAKGDLIVADGPDSVRRLAADINGRVLETDNTTLTGLRWNKRSAMSLLAAPTSIPPAWDKTNPTWVQNNPLGDFIKRVTIPLGVLNVPGAFIDFRCGGSYTSGGNTGFTVGLLAMLSPATLYLGYSVIPIPVNQGDPAGSWGVSWALTGSSYIGVERTPPGTFDITPGPATGGLYPTAMNCGWPDEGARYTADLSVPQTLIVHVFGLTGAMTPAFRITLGSWILTVGYVDPAYLVP